MITVAIAVGLAVLLYYFFTRKVDYWEKRGVKYEKPIPIFGSYSKVYLMRVSASNYYSDIYKNYPGENLVGYFKGSTPGLVIRDPSLAKRVMIADFNYFHRRGFFPESFKVEPLMKNQFTSDDDLWRQLRLRMTPAFSSGKLKAMFPLIVGRAERLQARLDRTASKVQAIDAKDLMTRFTNDVIGTIGFGIPSDSLNNDDDAMRQLGIEMLSPNVLGLVKFTLKTLFPKLLSHLKTIEKESIVTDMVESNMRQRNWEPSGRHDFIDLLLECKKKGSMTGESIVNLNADGTPKKVSIEMDMGIMAAQSMVFFIAGFETSSTASSFTLYQLAYYPDLQTKAQQEIDSVLAKHNKKISYDAISEMTYLRWCLNEGLRMSPPVGFLQRKCVHPYTFPGSKVTIEPGTAVIIPLEAYQNDEAIFPDPKVFRPERFDPEVMTAEQKLANIPFGEGPRSCIGERLGLMQAMAGLAAVLAQYSVKPSPGAPKHPPIKLNSGALRSIEGALQLIFERRKSL